MSFFIDSIQDEKMYLVTTLEIVFLFFSVTYTFKFAKICETLNYTVTTVN